MEEFLRRNFLKGVIILIGLYLLLISSLLCKHTTSIKDDIIGREYENKKLVKENESLKKKQDSLNFIINRQNSDIAIYYLQDEALVKELRRIKKVTFKKEYEKASNFTRNFTSDSISRYFSNL